MNVVWQGILLRNMVTVFITLKYVCMYTVLSICIGVPFPSESEPDTAQDKPATSSTSTSVVIESEVSVGHYVV